MELQEVSLQLLDLLSVMSSDYLEVLAHLIPYILFQGQYLILQLPLQ
jgi:hypothetical protein